MICERIPVGRSEVSLAGSKGTRKEKTWEKGHMTKAFSISWRLSQDGWGFSWTVLSQSSQSSGIYQWSWMWIWETHLIYVIQRLVERAWTRYLWMLCKRQPSSWICRFGALHLENVSIIIRMQILEVNAGVLIVLDVTVQDRARSIKWISLFHWYQSRAIGTFAEFLLHPLVLEILTLLSPVYYGSSIGIGAVRVRRIQNWHGEPLVKVGAFLPYFSLLKNFAFMVSWFYEHLLILWPLNLFCSLYVCWSD